MRQNQKLVHGSQSQTSVHIWKLAIEEHMYITKTTNLAQFLKPCTL